MTRERTRKRTRWLASLLGSLGVLATAWPSGASANSMNAPNQWVARFSTLKGDTTCQYGDPDCNRCAYNVAAKFAAWKGQTGKNFEYTFDVNKSYAPSSEQPREFLSRDPFGGSHLQGMTRIPIDTASTDGSYFAMTYGAGRAGKPAMYVVRAPTSSAGGPVSGTGRIAYISQAYGMHPGGSQALGHYLLTGHDEGSTGYLEVFDVSDPSTLSHYKKATTGDSRSAAMSGAQLAGGGALVLSKKAGANNTYQLYYAQTVERGLPGWEYIGSTDGTKAVENISLITECGTGDLYIMTATADEGLVYKNNYFDLYKLSMDSVGDSGAKITHVDSVTNAQDTDCDARAAGTAYVSKTGNLAFYCGQKLGTEVRDEVIDCLLPVDTDGCSGFWGCVVDWSQEIFAPGSDCVNAVKLDDSMTLRQYW